GLSFYRRICAQAPLKKGAPLFFECGYNQSEKIREILEAAKFTAISSRRDYAHIERVVCGLR
ncbi:MAG: peptide chain release factor N(5)-glutamine methyltransferase, partial [Eubacteriales bacterium]|nr:peptide chain release factor N(5)-glutamine methyltransferase [Eubacteriales bacterium]